MLFFKIIIIVCFVVWLLFSSFVVFICCFQGSGIFPLCFPVFGGGGDGGCKEVVVVWGKMLEDSFCLFSFVLVFFYFYFVLILG